VARSRRGGLTLPAECWCQAQVVEVAVEEIADGRTAECYRRHCSEEFYRAREERRRERRG